MAPRLRRCIECPKCFTRYLVGFSPYANGSYLVSRVTESTEEYRLFCVCGRKTFSTPWNWRELKTYVISTPAYERGYGAPDEVPVWREREVRLSRY